MTQARPALSTEAATRAALQQLALAVGVLLLACVGALASRLDDRVTAIWFANGLQIAVLLQVGVGRWAGFLAAGFIGNLIANFLIGDRLDLVLGLSLCNTLEVLMAAGFTRATLGDAPLDLARGAHLGRFLLLTALLPTTAASALAALVLFQRSGLPWLDSFKNWLPGDLLGVLMVVPLGLGAAPNDRDIGAGARRLVAFLPSLLLLVAVTVAVFALDRYPMLFLTLIPPLLIVYRHGKLGAAVGLFVLSIVAAGMTLAGHGPIASMPSDSNWERRLFLQGFLAFSFCLTLGAGVLIEQRRQLDASLRLTQERFTAIANNVPALIAYLDQDRRYRFVNEQYRAFYGFDPASMIGRTPLEVFGDGPYAQVVDQVDAVLRGESVLFERHAHERDRNLYLMYQYVPDFDADRAVRGFFVCTVDISARKQAELASRAAEERLQTITDNVPALITCLDVERRISFANSSYQRWFGIDRDQLIGQRFDEVLPEQLVAAQAAAISEALLGRGSEIDFPAQSGNRRRELRSTLVPLYDDQHRVCGVHILTADVTALKVVQKQLQMLAQFDDLTGLPNRREFEQRLEQALSRSRRREDFIAVMFLDVDHFKSINDRHGHAAGDKVLQEFAVRLRGSVREPDLVARLAGDEFVIVLEGVRSADEAQFIARKILHSMERPIVIGPTILRVGTTIGIALNHEKAENGKALVAKADQALYAAKGAGRGVARTYNARPRDQSA